MACILGSIGSVMSVSRCDACGFDWQISRADIVKFISERAAQYRPVMETMDAVLVSHLPHENVWSPLQYLAHMRDVSDFYHDRLHRVLVELRPTMQAGIGGVRFSRLAELRDYQSENSTEVLAAFEKSVALLCVEITNVDAPQWSRVGIGSDGDERSLLQLARRFAHEVHHHLGDITSVQSTTEV